MGKNEHIVEETGEIKLAGTGRDDTPKQKNLAEENGDEKPLIEENKATELEAALEELNKYYEIGIGGIEGYNPFTITPKLNKKPNPLEQFTVEFLLELDTGKKLVRFSKPNGITQKFTVVTVQLRDILRLKHSGFDIDNTSLMHGFVKLVSMKKEFKPTEIGESIGFTPDGSKFFNGEFVVDSTTTDELEKCWQDFLEIKEFRQILLCSVMGLGAAYLKKRIVPIVNIWGNGINVKLLKHLILSPFGYPVDGYRDIFYRDKSSSRLAYDRNIIPVIADLITYGKQSAGIEQSGDGYYIDGFGQFYAPLFVISKTPYFKDTHISIEMSSHIFENNEKFSSNSIASLYEVLYDSMEILSLNGGQLSCYLGSYLCSCEAFAAGYIERFMLDMEEREYPYEGEKTNEIDALGSEMQKAITDIFELGEHDWDLAWQVVYKTAKEQGEKLHRKMCEYIDSNGSAISESAEAYGYTDSTESANSGDKHYYIGFRSQKNNKEYLSIQEGAFNKHFKLSSDEKYTIFDYWLEIEKIDNSKKGTSQTQPYLKRVAVGKGNSQRKWFYEFCWTELGELYPPKSLNEEKRHES